MPTFDPDFNSFTYSLHCVSAKTKCQNANFFKPKKRSSPVPDHNPLLSQTQRSDSSLQNESQMDSATTSVTESSLSKTESVQCGPPYPDIAECMNDGSLHSDIVKKSLLTEKWNSAFGFKFPTRCLFKKSLTENYKWRCVTKNKDNKSLPYFEDIFVTPLPINVWFFIQILLLGGNVLWKYEEKWLQKSLTT